MEYTIIKDLIKKYFLAETSLEEEAQLKTYFQSEDIHPDLIKYKTFFDGYKLDKLDSNFDNRVLSLLKDEQSKTNTINHLYWLKIAAIFLIVASLSLFFYNKGFKSEEAKNQTAITQKIKTSGPMEDTFSDPEEAKRELAKALALMSSKLNHGKEEAAQNISRLNMVSKENNTSDN